ncbi:hypothetical protein OPV22_011661 [Ensete ventricosum]|uniref:DUF668 domain-containing protein n=1 Tax=Ensete ventricosum TaxID=4639 RepID=A0AAV8RFX2_ENSVE|nr:hypothetical protein OPV22_011661 [Ensete ventricosum]
MTYDLYHEMYDLGRSEKEYQRRLQDQIELPVQRDGVKHIGVSNVHQRLGQAGLALHYANVITQIVALDNEQSPW